MRKVILGVAFALVLGLGAARAEAATACYTWDCDDLTHVCSFNASCSSWSGNLWRFSWDFGDGSSALTGSATTSHTYGNTPYPTVTLTVIPLSSSEDSAACEIVVFNAVGPAQGTEGSCQ
jgi:hypothetical protein